jgi:hypothetical protein
MTGTTTGKRPTSNRTKKLVGSVLVVGVLGSVSAAGVFGAFSATTQNSGNEISTGTVAIGDNDLGSAMFQVANAEPGDSFTRCIKVTYTGSLQADVKNYLTSTVGPLTPYLNARVERGTQTTGVFPGCGDFTPAATGGTVFNAGFSDAAFPRSMATGITENPVGKTVWDQGDTLALRVTLSLDAAMPDTIQGASSGDATVVWQATNR